MQGFKTFLEKEEGKVPDVKSINESQEWNQIAPFFHSVKKPLFHATTGPRAMQIINHGLKSGGYSDFGIGNQGSISLTESLEWALGGHRGNYIFVLDEDEVSHLGKLEPYQSPFVENEYEKRYLGDKIPTQYLKGLIVNRNVPNFEKKEMIEFPFPVVSRGKHGWEMLT